MTLYQARLAGILTLILGLLLIGVLAQLGTVPPVAPLNFLIVVLAASMGGLRVGLVSAIAVGLYGQYIFPVALGRWSIIIASELVIAGTVGLMRRQYRALDERSKEDREKAALVDAINGNLKLLGRIYKEASDLHQGWSVLKGDARRNKLFDIVIGLGNLRQLAEGWHSMAQERDRLSQKED